MHTMTLLEDKPELEDKGRWWPQILALFVVGMACLSTGLLFAWSSPFSVAITNDKVNYNISEDEASYFILGQPIGLMIITPILLKFGDVLGPKKMVWLVSVPYTLSWIITMFAKSKWWFYVSRILTGIGLGLYYSAGPSYIGEITIPAVRGYYGNVPSVFVNLGLFTTTAVGSYFGVKPTAYLFVWCPILFGIAMFFLPESPYRLIRQNKFEQAKKSLQWLRRKRNIEDDFLTLKTDVERQLSERGTYKDLFTIPSNRRAVRAALLLRGSQQFSGISVFSNYTQMIFQKAGGNVSAKASSMIFIGTLAVLSLVCSATSERFGRRKVYFISILSCTIILYTMSIYFALDQYNVGNLEPFRWVPLAGMIVFVVCYIPGVGLIPQLMLGELFSSSIKSKGMCMILVAFGVSMYASSNIFTALNTHIGLYAPFLVYAIFCMVSAVLTLKWVPETQGKTLEEIQQILKKGY